MKVKEKCKNESKTASSRRIDRVSCEVCFTRSNSIYVSRKKTISTKCWSAIPWGGKTDYSRKVKISVLLYIALSLKTVILQSANIIKSSKKQVRSKENIAQAKNLKQVSKME